MKLLTKTRANTLSPAITHMIRMDCAPVPATSPRHEMDTRPRTKKAMRELTADTPVVAKSMHAG